MKKKCLLLIVPFMMLTACANIKVGKTTYTDAEINDIITDAMGETPIEVLPYEGELSPLELLDTIEQETSESLVKFHEGDDDQFITVVDANYYSGEGPYVSYGDYTPKESDVVLVDEEDNKITLEAISKSDGKVTYKVPVSKFAENHGYHVQLKNDAVNSLIKNNLLDKSLIIH